MYKVITYKDNTGADKVAGYINDLNKTINTNKDARVKYSKIMRCIDRLQTYGVAVGEPTVRRIIGTELWELRPLSDRIFFAYWKNNVFVLLHHFAKKTQKTPSQEIKQAERNLKDFLERYGK